MKKILIRLLGSLCIIASLYTLFVPAWVQIGGINRELKETREVIADDLFLVHNALYFGVKEDETIQEELEDSNLPSTTGQLKRHFKSTEKLLLGALDKEISFGELVTVSWKAPTLIAETQSMLETTYVSNLIFEASDYYYAEDVEEMVDPVADFKYVPYAVVAVFGLIGLLGVISALTHLRNKRRGGKYFYAVIVLLLVCGICIALPLSLDTVKSSVELPELLEDVSLKATFMPYVTLLLAIAPIVLDIIFEKKKKTEV